MDFRLLRNQLGHDAAEAQRLLAQRGPHPVLARGRRVAFVENQIDDFEHRREARGEVLLARDFETDARLGERALRADDALGDGRLRNEKGARDLVGRETREQAQRERDARLGGEHRMAGDEHQAQQIVADVVVHALDQGGFVIRRRDLLLELHLAGELFMLALEKLVAPEMIESAVLGGGHQPGARVVGDARPGPGLERGEESVLRELLGEADVARHAREAGDDFRRLDPPDRVDRAMGGGARHDYFFFAANCARRRSSCSLSSGVNSAPKSSASNTWRISISDSPLKGLGQRLTHSIASALDFTCHSQKPAISSFVSAKGPSITVRFVPENLTRAPFELAWSPSPASITPAFTSFSLNFPISARRLSSGRTPASESLVALTITMNRIEISPLGWEPGLRAVSTGWKASL